MKKKALAASETNVPVPPESPLVPNRTLQRMYEGMVQTRMVEVHLRSARHRTSDAPNLEGTEACTIAPLAALNPEDLVMDLPGTFRAALFRGTAPGDILRSLTKKSSERPNGESTVLPAPEHPRDRLALALGAALTLKQLGAPRVLVLFIEADVKASVWRRAWKLAATNGLPVLFVVFPPDSEKHADKRLPFKLSAHATAAGVPGIPVDSNDAIALFRVAQESIGRARTGGGPALMECIPFAKEGAKKHPNKSLALDPITTLGSALLSRRICDEQQLAAVASTFQNQLDAL